MAVYIVYECVKIPPINFTEPVLISNEENVMAKFSLNRPAFDKDYI